MYTLYTIHGDDRYEKVSKLSKMTEFSSLELRCSQLNIIDDDLNFKMQKLGCHGAKCSNISHSIVQFTIIETIVKNGKIEFWPVQLLCGSSVALADGILSTFFIYHSYTV